MSTFKYNILFHFLGIVLFLCIPLIFPPYSMMFMLKEFASYVFVVVFFYINYYYLVPDFYFKQRYGMYATILLISFSVITFFPLFIIFSQHMAGTKEWEEPHGMHGFLSPFYSDIKRNLFLFATAFFASIAFRINDHLKKLNQEKSMPNCRTSKRRSTRTFCSIH